MSDDAGDSPPSPALQQVHASAPVSVSAPASAPPQHQTTNTIKSEPPTTTLEKPLAEKLTDDPPSPTDDVAKGQ